MALKHPFHRAFSLFMAFLTIISKARKPVVPQSVIPHLGALELQLQPVGNQGDELTIGGLSLGVGHRVAKEALEGVQISSVPGYLDGVADGPLYPGRRGAEGLCHLGVEHLGNGVDHIHIIHGDDDGLPQILVALDVGGNADGVRCHVYGVNALVFIKLV